MTRPRRRWSEWIFCVLLLQGHYWIGDQCAHCCKVDKWRTPAPGA